MRSMLEEIYDLRPLRDLDGMYVLTAVPRHEHGQAFWFSDYRFPTPEQALRWSPDLRGPRGPVH